MTESFRTGKIRWFIKLGLWDQARICIGEDHKFKHQTDNNIIVVYRQCKTSEASYAYIGGIWLDWVKGMK